MIISKKATDDFIAKWISTEFTNPCAEINLPTNDLFNNVSFDDVSKLTRNVLFEKYNHKKDWQICALNSLNLNVDNFINDRIFALTYVTSIMGITKERFSVDAIIEKEIEQLLENRISKPSN